MKASGTQASGKQANDARATSTRSTTTARTATPTARDPTGLLELQRIVGNRAMRSLLHGRSSSSPIEAGSNERNRAVAAPDLATKDAAEGPDLAPAPARMKEAGGAPAAVDRQALSSRLGSGRPIEAPTRARMESALQYDFAHVRIHDDGEAAALSRDLNVRAFTLAEHVAFADGNYRAGTLSGDALLAHELAHVVQQGKNHAAGASISSSAHIDEAIEADADRAAEGAVLFLYAPERTPRDRGPRLRSGLRLSRAPKSGPAIYYNLKPQKIESPPAGIKLEIVEALLKENARKQKAADGTIWTWAVEGAKRGSDEYLHILYVILQFSIPHFRDREVDLVVEIGPGKRGAITVRIDANGNAVGSLVSRTEPTVPLTYRTMADAVTGLENRYKMIVLDGDYMDKTKNPKKEWSLLDLNKVAAALSRLSPQEAAALEGYVFIRTDDTDDRLQTEDGTPAAGLTVTGDINGLRQREILFAEMMFTRDVVSFVGGAHNAAPGSIQLILHEAAHAYERKVSVDAESDRLEALAERKRALERANKKDGDASNTKNAADLDLRKKGPKFVAAFQAAYKAISDLHYQFDSMEADGLLAKARGAVKKRDTLLAKGSVSTIETARSEQDEYLAATETLLDSERALNTARAKQKAAGNNSRLERFRKFVDNVDFVYSSGMAIVRSTLRSKWPSVATTFRQKGINPFTQYADKDKRQHPDNYTEFYADAVSLWHTDPEFLESSPRLKALKKFFDDDPDLK